MLFGFAVVVRSLVSGENPEGNHGFVDSSCNSIGMSCKFNLG